MEKAVAAMRAAVRLAEQGDAAGAAAGLTRAAAIAPKDPRLQVQCGNLLRQLRRSADALACFDRAQAVLPDNPAVLGNRAIALAELGRLEEALSCIDLVAQLRPGDPDTLVNRGSMRGQLGRWSEALADYDSALAIRPDHSATHVIRADLLLKLQRPSDALASCDRALALRPGDPQALANRASALLELKRPVEALAAYDRSLSLRPNHPATMADRGNALVALDRPTEALAAYDASLRLDPGNAHTTDHRGNALKVLGLWQEALATHEQAARMAPNIPGIRVHLGLCRLLLGDFDMGWQDYEFRRPPGQAAWPERESLPGKTVLLQGEQGFGDIVMFCRYAPLVKALGLNVLLAVPRPLVGLMATLAGVDRVVATDEPMPVHDFAFPLMSLPFALGTELSSVPSDIPYLTTDPARVALWSERLPSAGRKRVGVVWSGNADHPNDRHRSIPLARFARLVEGDADFVALQTDIRPADEAALRDILVPEPEGRDFADTAALLALMDVIVTVDTSIAHLAGAMGKPVWILLPFDPDWRWMLARDDSPWYPSARLFRQTAPGDWDGVLDRVASELSRIMQDR